MATKKKTPKSRVTSPSRSKSTASRSSKSVSTLKRPAAWFTSLGRGLDARERSIARGREVDYLTRTVKDLRQYMTGFESSDGYDLRYPETWSAQRVKAVRGYGSFLHSLTSSPHVRVLAKSKRAKKSLESFTGQVLRGSKKMRAFVVHDEHPTTVKVTISKTGQVEMKRRLPGVTSIVRTYLFEDVGFDPRDFVSIDDTKKAVRYMLKKKLLPKGHYQFWTNLHGVIGLPMDRDDLLLNLSDYGQRYGNKKGFEGAIIGVRFQGDELSAEKLNEVRQKRRRKAETTRYKARLEMDCRVTKWRKRKGI